MNTRTCPKCNTPTNTYRHLYAKIWCPNCNFVLREEGISTLTNECIKLIFNNDKFKNMEIYITGTGQKIKVHTKDKCDGNYCPIHNPRDSHMKDWPTHWRDDKGMMEVIDPLGVGHPHPDEYKLKTEPSIGIHGCNGLCNKEHFEKWLVHNKEFYENWLLKVKSK